MMHNNNTSVLPFYANIEEQNHRLSYAYGDVYPLFTKTNNLPPFQIIRRHREGAILTANIYNDDGTLFTDAKQALVEAGLEVMSYPEKGYDVIVYPARLPMVLNQLEGRYYLVISDGTETWYSDIYTCVADVSCYMKIEWWNENNQQIAKGAIVYEDIDFHNVLYLPTEVGKPEYQFEEVGENRDGLFFAQKQISNKVYKCTALAPEYLCDVMRFIRMADYVVITDKYGRRYVCDTFLMTPKWQTQGNLASVEMEFTTDTIVKKLGLGYIRPKATGDFNDDYNDDYKNK